MRASIDPGLSIYFDVARLGAAIVVLLHHVWPLIMPSLPIPWPGHEAVVVFFVLSGYVIAYTASDERMRLATYAEHRAARVLSVALPALLLAALIAPFSAGPQIHYAGQLQLPAQEFLFASLLNATFLGQSFGLNVAAPLNSPYWSICYEVWYYVIFAAWTFSGKRWRIALTVLALCLAGLKIVALLPVWLIGVALFHHMPRWSPARARLIFVATLAAALAFWWSGASPLIRGQLQAMAPDLMASLRGSNQFAGDTILGVIVALHFAAVASMGTQLRPLFRAERQIRFGSSFTFSTYLYHMPLTVLIWNGLGVHHPAAVLALLALFIVALGMVTERQVKRMRAALAQGSSLLARAGAFGLKGAKR